MYSTIFHLRTLNLNHSFLVGVLPNASARAPRLISEQARLLPLWIKVKWGLAPDNGEKMAASFTVRRKIKTTLLQHILSINESLMKLKESPKAANENILNIRKKINAILDILSRLNGNYTEETQATINEIIDTGKRIHRHRERDSIVKSQQTFDDWLAEISSLGLRTPMIMPIEIAQKYDDLHLIFEKSFERLKFLHLVNEIVQPLSFAFVLLALGFKMISSPIIFYNYALADIFLIIGVSSLVTYFITLKVHESIRKKRGFTNEDLTYVFTGRVISLLNIYIEHGRLKDRSEAIESMMELISLVNKWTYGNLTFITNQFGPTISLFKEMLTSRPLGIIKLGNKKERTALIAILSDFLRYLKLPSLEKLNKINDLLNNLDEKTIAKFNPRDVIVYWILSRNPIFLGLIMATAGASSVWYYSISQFETDPFLLFIFTVTTFLTVFLGAPLLMSPLRDEKLKMLKVKRSNAGIT